MTTCNQCQYAVMEKDVQTRICHGLPPTPLLTPGGILGARPFVRVRDVACCLFKQKEVVTDHAGNKINPLKQKTPYHPSFDVPMEIDDD